jgi:hypothetical protein
MADVPRRFTTAASEDVAAEYHPSANARRGGKTSRHCRERPGPGREEDFSAVIRTVRDLSGVSE